MDIEDQKKKKSLQGRRTDSKTVTNLTFQRQGCVGVGTGLYGVSLN